MTELVVASLAVFGVWEALRSVLPWNIPAWVQPILVTAGSVSWCWPDWRTGVAVLGAVGLLHVWFQTLGDRSIAATPIAVQRPSARVPRLPS